MKYTDICEGVFVRRVNRFAAVVFLGGAEMMCHVKNTGRLKELFVPGARVYLQKAREGRKTGYDIIAVDKNGRTVNVDSQAPNAAAFEYLKAVLPEGAFIKREAACGDSRIDLYYEAGDERRFVEVKGVTLEKDGLAVFPDAPTERGRKHLCELSRLAGKGYSAEMMFVIQTSGVKAFTPNRETDPAFCSALRDAEKAGVFIRALWCETEPDSMSIKGEIPVILG